MVKEIHPNKLGSCWLINKSRNHWLATQLGVTDMTVSRWCTNKNQPSISQLVEIAKLLNVDIKELIEDYDTNTL